MPDNIHIKSLQFTKVEITAKLKTISKILVVFCAIAITSFLINLYFENTILKSIAIITTLITTYFFIKKQLLHQRKNKIKKRIETLTKSKNR